MLIYLLRHGLTEYNAEKRYQGQRDIPLSAAGRAMLCRADISPKTVYITPLCRTRQTAEVLFPSAKLIEIDGLKEMCFGSFEGRNYIEMAAMERYALPHKNYYEWCAPNAGGFVLDAREWASKRVLHLVKTVQYTKEARE